MLETASLPPCRHRGIVLSEGRFACLSPRLVMSPAGVSEADCRLCPYADHLGPEGRAGIDPFSCVAPGGTRDALQAWTGRLSAKPWHYRLTAVIPHLDTPEPLGLVVELLRLQTVRPYLLVIDTGSPPEVCSELERLRADDLEVHYIRAHAYAHSSGAVVAAQDLAFALCRTSYLFCTHADVFLRRRDYLEWLLERCGERCPVVGYEMSERSWVTDEWRGTVSHTATMLYMPVLRRIGASWSLERYAEATGAPATRTDGWPDTESMFGLCLRQAGIVPLLLGPEPNFQRHTDDNIDHARSFTGSKVFRSGYHEQARRHLDAAMTAARQRLLQWQALPTRRAEGGEGR